MCVECGVDEELPERGKLKFEINIYRLFDIHHDSIVCTIKYLLKNNVPLLVVAIRTRGWPDIKLFLAANAATVGDR